MKIRQFNNNGIEAFRVFLEECRMKPEMSAPMSLLEDDRMTTPLAPAIEMDLVPFVTKADAAHYLHNRLSAFPEEQIDLNIGLWAWLTLLYFDSVAPTRAGMRTIRNDYQYILDAADSRNVYRHLLRMAWRILNVSNTHNRLLLSTPIHQSDKVTTEVMKRLFLVRIPCMFEVLDRLYWDPLRGRAKVGIVNQNVRAGDLVHRLPMRIRQLDLTFDLQSLNADQLIELLGSEFQPWLESTPA